MFGYNSNRHLQHFYYKEKLNTEENEGLNIFESTARSNKEAEQQKQKEKAGKLIQACQMSIKNIDEQKIFRIIFCEHPMIDCTW